MITILFISDNAQVSDLIARFQPRLRARMRLAVDFDQGLKEVFDNRPAAVFIQGEISGISGETVARHIKTLLRGEAPRIVLLHMTPLSLKGANKWFDDAVDCSLPQAELDQKFRERLMEIASDHWIEKADEQNRPAGAVAAIAANAGDAMVPVSSHAGESEPFDWEEPGNGVTPAAQSSLLQSNPDNGAGQESAPSDDLQSVQVGRGVETTESGVTFKEPELRGGMTSIIEETASPQPDFSGMAPLAPATTTLSVSSRCEAEPMPTPPQSSPPPRAEAPDERLTASLSDFSAESPVGEKAHWVTIPPPDQESEGETGRRLTLWSAAIVLFLIGVVAGGALLLKGKGNKKETTARPAAPAMGSVQLPPAPVPVAKAPSPEGIPSFVRNSGKDEGFGATHPGWERYVGNGVEYRLFREQGRLKAVQVIALRGRNVPETLVAAVVKELTGSESRTMSSRQVKGGYQLETGRVNGKGEIVIYRKRTGIKGVVVTLG